MSRMQFVIPGLTPYQVRGRLRNPVLFWIPASLENNFQIPPNPPLLKGGEGGFSLFAGVEPVMENFAGMTGIVVINGAVFT